MCPLALVIVWFANEQSAILEACSCIHFVHCNVFRCVWITCWAHFVHTGVLCIMVSPLWTEDHFGQSSYNHSGQITPLIMSDSEIPLSAVIDKRDLWFGDGTVRKERPTQSRSAIACHQDSISWLRWLWEAAASKLRDKVSVCLWTAALEPEPEVKADGADNPNHRISQKGTRRRVKAPCSAGAADLTFTPDPSTYL